MLVVDIDEAAPDPARHGGKGSSLVHLARVPGIRVPPAFIVTTQACRRILGEAGLDQQIETLEQALRAWAASGAAEDAGKQLKRRRREVLHRARTLRARLLACRIPVDVMGSVASCYRAMSKRAGHDDWGPPVAVRSSATVEDSPEDPFAGQFRTYLNQVGERKIGRSLKACLASCFSRTVLEYLVESFRRNTQRTGPAPERALPQMAVVVQQMVDARTAGVAFDVNHCGEEVCAISANYGLGESVVAGLVKPESWEVHPQTYEILRCCVGNKVLQVVPRRAGTRRVRIARTGRASFALRDSEAVKIAKAVAAVGEYYQSRGLCHKYIDTEFVIARDGTLHFVQARPEVTWSRRTKEDLVVTVARPCPGHPVLLSGGWCGNEGATSGRLVVADIPVDQEPRIRKFAKRIREGDILVARATNLNWNSVFGRLAGVVTNLGDPNCHAAITSRVFGIPAIVGREGAVETLMGWGGKRVTLCGHDLQVLAGRAPLISVARKDLRPRSTCAIRLIEEDEAAIAAKEVEFTKARGLLITNSEGNWMRNPPWPYGRFQLAAYVAAFKALAQRTAVEIRTRVLTDIDPRGELCSEIGDMTRVGAKLRQMTVAEMEEMFREREATLARWDGICARLAAEPTTTQLTELLDAYVAMLVHTHAGFNFNLAVQHAIAKGERKLTSPQRQAYRTFLDRLSRYEEQASEDEPFDAYARLMGQARANAHLFLRSKRGRTVKRDVRSVIEDLGADGGCLWDRVVEFSRGWAEVEQDDLRLQPPLKEVVASIQSSLVGEPASYSYVMKSAEPIRRPAFPDGLKAEPSADELQRLALLYPRLGALKIRQHYLLPRGGWRIRDFLHRIGQRLVERGVLRRAEECVELTPKEILSHRVGRRW